jgi:glycosyltransferase involved in cell wall biosynthesis
MQNKNPHITYLGMLPYEKTLELFERADLLVNPREEDLYTRYSFPSKIFDYLASGKKIMCFKLPGIPEEYDEYLNFFTQNDPNGMMKEIEDVLEQECNQKECARDFLKKKEAAVHIQNILSIALS